MLDPYKICFITCVDNEKMYEESLLYINHLKLPEDYKIETACVKDSKSIASAYNQVMKNSDAKYKVYMHQDVFITNKNFIKDFLAIFEKYPEVGMLGMAGAKTIPPNGIWWESPYRFGKVHDSHTGSLLPLIFTEVTGDYEKVKAVDGLLMITQYDIPWREEIFTGWHFYDASQSIEFQKAGYEVAVPRQETPWCIHDCGIIPVSDDYHRYRNIFLGEYSYTLL